MSEYLQIANHASKLSDICRDIASGCSGCSVHKNALLEQSRELSLYLNGKPAFSKKPQGLVDSFEGLALALEFEERFLSEDYNPKYSKGILLARKMGIERLESVASTLACVEYLPQFNGAPSTALSYIFRKWHHLAYSVHLGDNADFFNQLAFKTHERLERRRQFHVTKSA